MIGLRTLMKLSNSFSTLEEFSPSLVCFLERLAVSYPHPTTDLTGSGGDSYVFPLEYISLPRKDTPEFSQGKPPSEDSTQRGHEPYLEHHKNQEGTDRIYKDDTTNPLTGQPQVRVKAPNVDGLAAEERLPDEGLVFGKPNSDIQRDEDRPDYYKTYWY